MDGRWLVFVEGLADVHREYLLPAPSKTHQGCQQSELLMILASPCRTGCTRRFGQVQCISSRLTSPNLGLWQNVPAKRHGGIGLQ